MHAGGECNPFHPCIYKTNNCYSSMQDLFYTTYIFINFINFKSI